MLDTIMYYPYLLIDVLLLIVWFVILLVRQDLWHELLLMSSIFGVVGIFAEYFYTMDWWQPLTITHTRIGIEDFVFGWTIGGISAVLFDTIFHEDIRRSRRKISNRDFKQAVKVIVPLAGLFVIIMLIGNGITTMSVSFIANMIVSMLFIFIMWYARRDLIVESMISGCLIAFLGIIITNFGIWIYPNFIDEVWMNMSGIRVLNTPIEDIFWYFLAGSTLSIMYEFIFRK